MNDFLGWLNRELSNRGWSHAELARRIDYSKSAVSMTMSGQTQITWEFCAAVAEAFNIPPEDLFRRAGLLRSIPDPAGIQELMDIAKNLNSDEREQLTDFARYLFQKK